MTAITRALSRATNELGGSDTPRLDAELLMAEALHIDRDRLILSPPDRDVPERFWTMLERRKAGEPVAYITGRRAFWNIELHVGPGVLIPRPDSEVLIASALEHFEGTAGPRRILDLGTGPGTLLLAALDLWPEATGLGVDLSRQALSYASSNSRRLGFEARAKFSVGNWADGIAERVIFRSLFSTGMTVFDPLDDDLLGGVPSMSHMSARQEYRVLVNALNLPASQRAEARREVLSSASSDVNRFAHMVRTEA